MKIRALSFGNFFVLRWRYPIFIFLSNRTASSYKNEHAKFCSLFLGIDRRISSLKKTVRRERTLYWKFKSYNVELKWKKDGKIKNRNNKLAIVKNKKTKKKLKKLDFNQGSAFKFAARNVEKKGPKLLPTEIPSGYPYLGAFKMKASCCETRAAICRETKDLAPLSFTRASEWASSVGSSSSF